MTAPTPAQVERARESLAPFAPFVATHAFMQGAWLEALGNIARALADVERETGRADENFASYERVKRLYSDSEARVEALEKALRTTWLAIAFASEHFVDRKHDPSDVSARLTKADDICDAALTPTRADAARGA